MNKILQVRDRVLKGLSDKLKGFYLAGGTALSLFYFQHRESYDLDFFTPLEKATDRERSSLTGFTQEFPRRRIEEITAFISKNTGFTMELTAQQSKPGFAKMLVYELLIDKENALKIDFVEDVYPLAKPLRSVDGIPVLSIEDIYIRKIITTCGSIETVLPTGGKVFAGGRQEAKDFFDLYFLSNTFMPLSKFVSMHCAAPQKESIVVWYRTYDRFAIKSGLADIITNKKAAYETMERHFKEEVQRLISEQI